jgi:Domain of unknown function (DUF3943)
VRLPCWHPVRLFTAALALTSAAPVTAHAQERLPCPDCNPPKRFWTASWQLMAVQLIPWSVNSILRDAEWADISLETWGDNIQFPWQYDNNKFLNNQFSHPYHGNLYFNAARTNGYNFWESAPWSFGGSLMWELFGEVWAPSPNDLLNTTLGGITLGETTYRLSSLILDNTATGSERTFREIAAALVNPVRGFNRLTRGQMNDVVANPPDWRPNGIFGSIEAGYRRFTTDDPGDTGVGGEDALNQTFLHFLLIYGNETEDLGKAPFSTFFGSGMISSNSGGGRTLAELRARGNLAARPVFDDSDRHQLAAFMTYTYFSNPIIEFGAQGFSGGLVTRNAPSKGGVRLSGEALAHFMPIAAIRSDYFVTAEGRDYDYGLGAGAQLMGRAVWGTRLAVTGRANYTWLPVVSGFSGDHHLSILNAEARYYFTSRWGVGLLGTLFSRASRYDDLADVDEHATELRAFVSLAVPGISQ